MLSYPCQKSIIEKLDPNLRFRISRVSPGFRRLEKLSALRIRKLILKPDKIQMNDVVYEIIGSHFLAKRNESITTETLEVYCRPLEVLQDSTKFKTKNLLITNTNASKALQNLPLDFSSLPLESITLDWTNFPLESPIFQDTPSLIIRDIYVFEIWNHLENLPQRNIHFLKLDGITSTVHMCKKKMVQLRLQKRCSFGLPDFDTKTFFVQYFNGLRLTGGNKERWNPETRNTIYPFRVIQPLDDGLEVHYYYEKTPGYKNEHLQNRGLGWNFVMEMLSV